MRDRETIDSELRLQAAVRRSIREHGSEPSSRQVDELLDERLGHRTEACETDDITPYGRKGVLRRFGLLAALPLSLVAVAIVSVVMFAVHNPHPAAQPTVVPPSGAPPNPAAPTVVPPSGTPPNPAAPKAQAPPLDIVDRMFIDGLKQDGMPVPSHEYVMIHGHAVCDFLAHQPNFAEAARFVQRSSIWDANQSTDFTAGAIVSYCPQHEPAIPDEMQQAFQNVFSGLQGIEGGLQGIQGDLQGIEGGLQGIQGGLQGIEGGLQGIQGGLQAIPGHQ